MGILDDAIREHLELIRNRGATDSEVQRLEDEAFGPPTRPGEADFPESEEGAASENGNGLAMEEPPGDEAVAHEDVTTLLPAEGREQPPADVEVGAEEPVTGDHPAEEPQEEAAAAEPEAEMPFAEEPEPVAEEHAIVDEGEPEAAEEAPAGEEGTTFYDQSLEEELDLTLEDEAPAAEPPSEELETTEPEPPEEPPSEEHTYAEPEGTTPLEPPIESFDTVEHPFPEEIVSEEEAAADERAPAGEPPAEEEGEELTAEPEPDGEEAEGEEGEDVLADTPEFLKDAPEDDELWFEQGEPKDFDF